MICNSEFRDKSPKAALFYLDYIAKNVRYSNIVISHKSSSKHQPSPSSKGDLQDKFVYLARKVKALKSKKSDHVKSVQDVLYHVRSSTNYFTQESLTLTTLKESFYEQANATNNFKIPNLNPYSQTYNHAQPLQPHPSDQNF